MFQIYKLFFFLIFNKFKIIDKIQLSGCNTDCGRLEVFLDDKWGSVCSHGWTKKESDVACRSLGFDTSFGHVKNFGKEKLKSNIYSVKCNGNESHLNYCKFMYKTSFCDNVGIMCTSNFKKNFGYEVENIINLWNLKYIFDDYNPFTIDKLFSTYNYYYNMIDLYKNINIEFLLRYKKFRYQISDLLKRGLKINSLGIDYSNINDITLLEKNILRYVYLEYNPHLIVHDVLDESYKYYYQDGIIKINNFGLTEKNLNSIKKIFYTELEKNDNKKVSKISNNSVITVKTYIPELSKIFSNKLLMNLVKNYLGENFIINGYKITKLMTKNTNEYIASEWHHDRVGRRLKMFIFLDDVDCDLGHPTLVAQKTNNIHYYVPHTYEGSRFKDNFITKNYKIVKGCGKKGGGFIFDTNTIHKGTANGIYDRLTVIIEFHHKLKCDLIKTLGYYLPCPSGDLFLI